MTSLAVYIPAHDEAGYINECLSALLDSNPVPASVTVVVACNACRDATAEIARGFSDRAGAQGWRLQVIETASPGKLNALNLAEAACPADLRLYLDADVTVSSGLLPALVHALDQPGAAYASGTPRVVAPARGLVAQYARFWQRLPFLRRDVPGFGLFAVNAAGRDRWGTFPDIISDDTFVRLHFAPSERIGLAEAYAWPMIPTLAGLVRVRRRQDAGVAEIAALYPNLLVNDGGTRPGMGWLARAALADPAGFAVYAAVALAVRLPGGGGGARWARGR